MFVKLIIYSACFNTTNIYFKFNPPKKKIWTYKNIEIYSYNVLFFRKTPDDACVSNQNDFETEVKGIFFKIFYTEAFKN